MNRIVREHYPFANLPDHLRQEFAGQVEVKITVEVQPASNTRVDPGAGGQFSRFHRLAQRNYDSMEQIVAEVRAQRDEWDERDRLLHPER